MNPNPKLQVFLNKNRSKTGVAMLQMPDGTIKTWACLGKSDNAAAAAHDNPTRNPLLAFGDLPIGCYKGTVVPASALNETSKRSYGEHRRVLLTPSEGECMQTVGVRWGLMIHGGAPGAKGALRPTHGCLRLAEDNMKELLDTIGNSTLDVLVSEV